MARLMLPNARISDLITELGRGMTNKIANVAPNVLVYDIPSESLADLLTLNKVSATLKMRL